MADDKAAEVTLETVVNEVAEEVKTETEVKDEKTPETPVTEPITNGSSTPESPKAESPATEEPTPTSPESVSPAEIKAVTEPEMLPVNGLSLEEVKEEIPEAAKIEESKPTETIVETTEPVPAPEIPVKKEDLGTEKTADLVPDEIAPISQETSNIPPNEVLPLDETCEKEQTSTNCTIEIIACEMNSLTVSSDSDKPSSKDESNFIVEVVQEDNVPPVSEVPDVTKETVIPEIKEINDIAVIKSDDVVQVNGTVNLPDDMKNHNDVEFPSPVEIELNPVPDSPEVVEVLPPPPPENEMPAVDNDIANGLQNTPDMKDEVEEIKQAIINSNHLTAENDSNGIEVESNNGSDDIEQLNLKNKTKDSLANTVDTVECNGNTDEEKLAAKNEEIADLTLPVPVMNGADVECGKVATSPDDSMPPSLSEAPESMPAGSNDASEAFPPPPDTLSAPASPPASPATTALPQELPISDKMVDLITEVPTVPELKTETLQETTSDVVAAN